MRRVIPICFVAMVLALAVGSQVFAQNAPTKCPVLAGTWNFIQHKIVYRPGVQADPFPVKITGTIQITQNSAQYADDGSINNCLFSAVKTNASAVSSEGITVLPSSPVIFTGAIRGEKIIFQAIAAQGTQTTSGNPAVTAIGKFTRVDRKGRPTEIEYMLADHVGDMAEGTPGFFAAESGYVTMIPAP